MGHVVGIAITGVMLLAMTIYVGYGTRKRWGGGCHKYGPLILVLIAFPLILMEPLRHVLQDTNVWTGSSVHEYKDGCESGYLDCMSVTGWLITITATYVGFVLLFIGSLWNANICKTCSKIREKWRALRNVQTEEAEGTSPAH